jgi:hypothetical protein
LAIRLSALSVLAPTLLSAACGSSGTTLKCQQSLDAYCRSGSAAQLPCVRHVDPSGGGLIHSIAASSYCAQVGVTVDFSNYSCSDGKVFGFSVLPIGGPGDEKNFVYDRQTGNLIQVIDGRLSSDPGTCVGGPPTTPDHGGCFEDATSTLCNGPVADGGPDALSE